MAIKGAFYATSGTDRPYYYTDFNASFRDVFTNGIAARNEALSTQMQVSAVPGTMKSQVNPGTAYVEGIRTEIYAEAEQATHDAADVSNPRYDIVALEVNTTAGVRNSRIVIVKGTPAASPMLPALAETSARYQMPLANVLIHAGDTDSTQFAYTDTRMISNVPLSFDAANVAVDDSGFTAIEGDDVQDLAADINVKVGERVKGPATNTDGYIPQWNGLNSKELKNGLMLDTDGAFAANSDGRIASQKAVKTYADTKVKAPASNTDSYIPQWNGANSKELKNGLMLDTDGTLSANSDARVASQKAVKTLAAAKENILNADQKRKITISASAPSGGVDGDIWLKY